VTKTHNGTQRKTTEKEKVNMKKWFTKKDDIGRIDFYRTRNDKWTGIL
jgi:hypothetical protein